jgi:hypothetical protein
MEFGALDDLDGATPPLQAQSRSAPA